MTVTLPVPLWLRWWAWLTVALTLPLASLGAEVTTKRVGMVDPKGFRSPFFLFQRDTEVAGEPIRALHLLETGQIGMLIEHSHRFSAVVVGMMTIVLCVGLFIQARGWRRWLGLVSLLAVSSQGLLGYFRVSEISTLFAALHGCAAQLVFALLAAVATLLSPVWARPGAVALRWFAAGLLTLLYAQIVCGALMRHLLDPVAQRLHVLLAFAAVVGVLWLARKVRTDDLSPAARTAAHLLAALIAIQPILGVEAWIRRFGSAELPDAVQSTLWGDLFRSGHHVLGTVIFATAAVLTVLLWRPRTESISPATLHQRAMEGVA